MVYGVCITEDYFEGMKYSLIEHPVKDKSDVQHVLGSIQYGESAVKISPSDRSALLRANDIITTGSPTHQKYRMVYFLAQMPQYTITNLTSKPCSLRPPKNVPASRIDGRSRREVDQRTVTL